MANDQLFIDVLAQIEREPLTWNQSDWGPLANECGTAYCMAGWACVLSGASKEFVGQNGYTLADFSGRLERVSIAACDLLGIEHDDRLSWEDSKSQLFDGANSLEDLYEKSAAEMGIDVQVLRDKVQDALR